MPETDRTVEDLIEKLISNGSEAAKLEEIDPRYHGHVREYIHSRFDDRYYEVKSQGGNGIISKWDLVSDGNPKIMGYEHRDKSMIIPYANLFEKLQEVFEKDRDPHNYKPISFTQDITLNNAVEIDNLPTALGEYWGETVQAKILQFRLKTPMGLYRIVEQRVFYSPDNPSATIGEMWIMKSGLIKTVDHVPVSQSTGLVL